MKFVAENSRILKATKESRDNWTNFSIGSSLYNLQASASVRDRKIYAGLQYYEDPDGIVFDRLLPMRDLIDLEMPGLEWDHKPGRKKTHWFKTRLDTDITDQTDWINQFQWLLTNLELARKTIAPRLEGAKDQ